jgi:hypothetical protein
MHGPRSCLLPIEGSGVHAEQEGSRAAIREYLELLEANPGDMTARWLLNVAFMTGRGASGESAAAVADSAGEICAHGSNPAL